MWLVLCWLIGLHKLIYHFILTFLLLAVFVCYKIFGSHQVSSLPSSQPTRVFRLQEHLERQQRLLRTSGGHLRDKIKLAIMSSAGRSRGGREAAPLRLSPSCVSQHLTINSNSNSNSNNNNNNDNDNNLQDSEYSNRSNSRSNRNPRSAHWASGQCRGHAELNRSFYLAAVCVLLAAGHWPAGTYCLEQDAEVLKPVANIAKSMIRTVTLGDPLEIHLDPTGLAKNFAYFTWRTGFPINMPKGFIQKAQDFYNRVKSRADQTPVDDVERKTLASLKVELDKIVDDIVAEVGQSPDGLYTDYLQTRVNGVPLEDACTAVAVQLKAYGVDLTNYRDIAGIVLGIPVIPSVASAMMNVANLASMEAMANLTSMAINPLSTSGELLNQLPGSALRSVSKVSNSALNSILLLSGGHGTAASQEQARADGEAAAAAQPVFA